MSLRPPSAVDGDDFAGRHRDGSSSSTNPALPIPLTTFSRSLSPAARSRNSSEAEDDEDASPERRLLHALRKSSVKEKQVKLWEQGGLGHALFHTPRGRAIYTALLVFWVGGCQFGTLLINRFILWTGTYKFPYPLTMTLMQLVVAHVFLLGFANFTRLLRWVFYCLGMLGLVAPDSPIPAGPQGFKQAADTQTTRAKLLSRISLRRGGIDGYGLFDFRWQMVKKTLPLAVVFFAKVVLSNISYAYAVLPVYQCARIGVVPFSLFITALFDGEMHSTGTLSSSLTATFNLLMASIQSNQRAPWQSTVSGIFSASFVALYPVLLLRTYKAIATDVRSQLHSDEEQIGPIQQSSASTRAYYTTLHYTSLLTILILLPVVAVSGEPRQILRNCYFLDESWFWFLIGCASLGGFAVFSSTLLLILDTTPLTATFVMIPRSAFQLTVLSKFHLQTHSWVGVGLCTLSCIWYTATRSWDRRAKQASVERQ